MVTWVQILDEADCINIALIPLEKAWIQLFSLHLRVNSRVDISPWLGNQSWRKKTEFKPIKLCLKINLESHPTGVEGLVNANCSMNKQYVEGVQKCKKRWLDDDDDGK